MKKIKKSNTSSIPKEDFIKILSFATPEEINSIIKNRGKPIKPITPAYFIGDRK